MPVVSSTIPNLINGISQQPDPIRLTSECTLQQNGYASPVKGVKKRPPFRHIGKLLSGNTYGSAFVHTINRDLTERYTVIFTSSGINVWHMSGNARTVTAAQGYGYLNCSNPSQDLSVLTVADYTFIVNKTVTCAMLASSKTAVRNKDALIYVRAGNYGQDYIVTVNGSNVANYTTSSTDVTTISTAYIANQLYSQMVTNLGTTNWNIVLAGSCIYLQQKNAGTDFTIVTQDGSGGTSLLAIKDKLQNFSDLPQVGYAGFQVEITGDDAVPYSGYYVTYQAAAGSGNNGVWVECTGQGITTEFDATTMPYELIRNADGTFTFQQIAWVAREVGDDVSNSVPSFIGRTLADVFFHRNRLGFLAGSNVIMSKAGTFFQLFVDTATQVLDSDPIDVSVNDVRVSTLRAAVPFLDQLLLFSDEAQYSLGGQTLLSPKTVAITPQIAFENYAQFVKPIYVGKVVYFAVPRGSYIGIREFQLLPINNQTDAPEITANVPEYIPAGAFKLAGSANDGMLAVLSTGNQQTMWVYKWYWEGNEKKQSCWSDWDWPSTDTVLNVDFIQNDMYVVVQRADGVYLELCHLDVGFQDTGFQFQIGLDRLVSLPGTYNAGTNTTTWTLPYAETNTMQVVLGSTFPRPGVVLTTTMPNSTTITATGNYSAGACWVGRQYTFRYRFSHIFVREYVKGGGFMSTASVQEGRLQLNHMSVTYEDSGYFRAEVTPDYRDMSKYQMTGKVLGTSANVIGSVTLDSGDFKFPVLSRSTTVSIDLVNDTYLPSTFQCAEWEGKYYLRSQRV